MKIINFFEDESRKSWKGRLEDAVDKAPLSKGLYIVTLNNKKNYIGFTENSLKGKFLELYNGIDMDEDTTLVDIYENRENVEVYWVEEPSLSKAKEYVGRLENELGIHLLNRI